MQSFTTTGVKKGEVFAGDVCTSLKNKNLTADVKADTKSNVWHICRSDKPSHVVHLEGTVVISYGAAFASHADPHNTYH